MSTLAGSPLSTQTNGHTVTELPHLTDWETFFSKITDVSVLEYRKVGDNLHEYCEVCELPYEERVSLRNKVVDSLVKIFPPTMQRSFFEGWFGQFH